METEIKVPMLPESVADATVAKWHKKIGEVVKRDENLVDIETDKVVLEVPAPVDGVLQKILQKESATVKANELLAIISSNKEASVKDEAAKENTATQSITPKKEASKGEENYQDLTPAVRRMAQENNINIDALQGSGKGGRIMKEDIAEYLEGQKTTSTSHAQPRTQGHRPEERVPMSRLRQRISERLLGAQQNMAILTTFNEINMQGVMDLRKEYKEEFEKAFHIRLGFMSFFVKAAVTALKRFPDVNAFIDGNDIVYHGYFDIGVAVSTERGLVVPVLRDAEKLSMADIEKQIADFATKAKNNRLSMEEMTGGTFTITNGGVFGSLLATPIINPPQSAILGMHKIEDRPVVENGQIVIRPMMYVALSYDHRIIDGKDSVQFLKTIKELIEDPARLLLDV